MQSLRDKGYFEPLREYIKSGKPYMGICIGMQALFRSSEEAPDQPGLNIIDAHVARFDSTSKAVPAIGWNGATLLRKSQPSTSSASSASSPFFGLDEEAEHQQSFYFVHSYRASYDGETQQDARDWALTVTEYGDERYVSCVQRKNVFATQFHPEKSGAAGLAVLRAWLEHGGVSAGADELEQCDKSPVRPEQEVRAMLDANPFKRRVVACLDVRSNDDGDLVVTKGDQYDVRESDTAAQSGGGGGGGEDRRVRNLGKPVDLARRYFAEGADEIAFLNITSFRSCPLHDQPMLDVVRGAAETVFVPLTIGGGIRDTTDPDGTKRSALDVAGAYFRSGADKVSIGSDAVFAVERLWDNDNKPDGQSSIEQIARGYGAQAVVVSIDPKRVYATSLEDVDPKHRPSTVDLAGELPGGGSTPRPDLGPNGEQYCWYQCTVSGGRATRDMDVVQLAQGVERLGAGEILLNSVDRDGSKAGFDLRLVSLVKNAVKIPVIASSGAGKVEDFSEVFQETNVEAALAAGIFHRREVPLSDVKDHLRSVGIGVRADGASAPSLDSLAV